MRKLSIAALILMLTGAMAYAAPVYTETWDFEDGTVGSAHPDWDAGTVQDTAAIVGQPYPDGNRLYCPDGTAANHSLPTATNSFIYEVDMYTDAGDINEFQDTGISYFYMNESMDVNEAWLHGDDWTTLYFGDPWLPNPRPGTADDWSNYQWQGGGGRSLSAYDSAGDELGKYYMGDTACDWNMPQVANVEMRIEYNTADNPGRVEIWFRSLNYDNVRAAQGEWLQLGWNGSEESFYDFILPTDTAGDPYDVFQIQMGGSSSWSQSAFDNVYFESGDNVTGFAGVPEPATIGLLGLGSLVLIRRRRHA
jgi:hypothetical protein